MSETPESVWQRVAAFIAFVIVRLWPRETKHWGRAYTAELPEIEGFRATLGWLIGGTMLLTRERFRSFLKSFGRPFGVPAGGPLETVVKSSMSVPRAPRVVTVLLLLASLAILLHPETRTSLSAALSSSSRDSWDASKWRSFHKLRQEAARTGDPKLLAVLSLLSFDNKEDKQREPLAEEAIAKDSSFIWLDYRYSRRGQSERLRKWDPDNAAVRLIPAESLFENIESASHDTTGFVHAKNHELTALEKDAAAHPEWMAAMDYAFSAPNYDTYTSQELQLLRDVTRKYGVSDPDIGLKLLYGQGLPDFINLITYTHVVLDRASEAERRGDLEAAVAGASKILHFTQNMQLHSRSSIEEVIAASLARQACENLQPALEKAGRKEEAALIGFELAQWNAVIEGAKIKNPGARESESAARAWTALTIRIAAFAIVALALACIVGLLVLALRNRDAVESRGWLLRVSSLTVEFAPILLLFATTTLFLAYHPHAQIYRSYIEGTQPLSSAEAMESFVAAATVVHVVPETIEETVQLLHNDYLLWLSTTVLLSILAVFFLYRMLPRQRTV